MLGKVVALAALGGFLFGYDLGLIGGAILGIAQAFNTSNATKEAIVGAAKLGAFFGTFLGGVCMLRYGRRKAISLQAAFFVAGPVLMAGAPGPAALIIGRLLVGLGIGASAIVVPAYLAEIAPAKNRGMVVQMYEVMLTLGMLAAVLANLGLSAAAGASAWRWMVGLPAVPGACLLMSLVSLPESPRWLVMRGQLDEALATLHTIIASSSSSSSESSSSSQAAARAAKKARQRSKAYRKWALQQQKQQQQQGGSGGGARSGGVLQLEDEQQEDAEWLNAAPQGGRPRNAQQQALEAAEDELLLLWSSVQKEQAAGLELRQSAASGAAAPVTAAAGGGVRFAVQPAPAAAFSLEEDEEEQQQQQQQGTDGSSDDGSTRVKGPASKQQQQQHHQHTNGNNNNNQQQQVVHQSAAGVDYHSSSNGDQRGLAPPPGYTHNNSSRSTSGGGGGPPSRLQALQQKLHLGGGGGSSQGDDGQQQLLLGPLAVNSSGGGGVTGVGGSRSSGGGLSPRRAPGHQQQQKQEQTQQHRSPPPLDHNSHHQQQQQQQQPHVTRRLVEPGRESNLAASLWAMLCDIKAVARGPERAAFAIACCLAVFDQATASTAIINYAPEVLSNTMGVQDPSLAILYPAAIALAKVVGTLIAAVTVDKYGRKPLLIWGGVGCAVTLALTGVSLAARSVAFFLAALCLFIFSFSISWAGLYWVVVSEIFSMGAKSPATSAATSLLFLTGAAVDFVYLSLVTAIGGAAFGIFGVVAAGSAWYVWKRVPETKGRTLTEIHALLSPAGASGGSIVANGGFSGVSGDGGRRSLFAPQTTPQQAGGGSEPGSPMLPLRHQPVVNPATAGRGYDTALVDFRQLMGATSTTQQQARGGV